MSYLPCELHCHTVHSDGDFTVRQLEDSAVNDHLALIALTDHNTSSGCDELNDSIIPSELSGQHISVICLCSA